VNRPRDAGQHPAEFARIGVQPGRVSFACGECDDEVVVRLTSPDALIDAWEAFVREHHACMR
jgi:hypothetical protein